jgi:porphobilinogen synthase
MPPIVGKAKVERLNPAPNRAVSKQLDLPVRPRRNRKSAWARRLGAETVLTVDDLVWPIFLCEGTGLREPIASMPGVVRYSVDEAVRAAEQATRLKIPALALFPNTDPKLRDADGSEALNPGNLVCRALTAIKREFPDLGLAADVALDPYTSHGHDGLLVDGKILNDETVAVLVEQAKVLAAAGADVVAPSDMMVPTRRSTRPAFTARSATPSARARPCKATSAPIRWTRPIPTRRCASARSTSRKAPTC